MKITLNEDFETEFKNEAWKGFTRRELLFAALALAAGFSAGIAAWWVTGLPINVCVYFGIPFIIVVGLLGLYTYQGKSTIALAKEIRYMWKTRKLACRMEERGGGSRIFSMKPSADRRKKHGSI